MTKLINILLLTLLIFLSNSLIAQSEDKVTFNQGVDAYLEGDYSDAQSRFEAAYERNKKNTRALYNAGNAAYLNGDFELANQYYADYAKLVSSPKEKAKAFFNQGNTFLQQADAMNIDPSQKQEAQKLYKKAVSSYKNALKNNPADKDSKYNLTYALSKIEQNQDQQNSGGGQGEKPEQKEKDPNGDPNDNQDQNGNPNDQGDDNPEDEGDEQDQNEKGDQEKNDQNEDKENQDQNGDNEDQQDEQGDNEINEGEEGNQDEQDQNGQGNQGEEEQEAKISRAQAEQDLDAINEEEENILKKVYGSRNGNKSGSVSSGKDW